jgi:hypothetical protein
MEKRLQDIQQQLLLELAKLKIQEEAVAKALKENENKLSQLGAIMQYEQERKAEEAKAAQPSE